ncbi:MAG: hypothetical protein QOF60_1109 [Actinomycetota bacterium]|jgi:hypothetical protein|nr:hypothetical protein [Actinomycetota bacterium]
MQTKRTATVLVAGVAVLAVVVAVYLVRQDRRPAEERIAAIPKAVKDAGTFRYTVTVSDPTNQNASAKAPSPSSTTPGRKGRGAITPAATPETVKPTTQSGVVDAKNDRATTELKVQNLTLQVVSDGKAAYVVVPEKLRDKTGGKEFARLGAGGGRGPGPVAAPFGGAASAINPAQDLAELRTPKSKIETVGHEKVRGTDTTHYRTTIDLTKTLTQAGTTSPGNLEAFRQVPVDVWLDAHNRPRRQVMNVKSARAKTTVEAFDYGVKVTIPTPKPDQVFDSGGADILAVLAAANATQK